MVKHNELLYTDLRDALKQRGIRLGYAADELGITLRSLEMKLNNIKGSTFRINEMYELLHMIGETNDRLGDYFPEYQLRRRTNA